MKKAKALHVSFNKVDPIILVGDERGGVNCFKLSKSLCKGPMQPEPMEDLSKKTEDEKKKILAERKGKPTTAEECEAKKMEDFIADQDTTIY